MIADLAEIVVFPAFMEGFLSPANDALDVAVAVALTRLLGWHWAFLPTLPDRDDPGGGPRADLDGGRLLRDQRPCPVGEVPTATRVDPPPAARAQGLGPAAAVAEAVGHVRDHDPGPVDEGQPQQHRRLRVQELVPPLPGHELRHHDGERLVGLPEVGDRA